MTVPTAARPYQGRRAGVVTRMTANALDLLLVILTLFITYLVIAGFLFVLQPRSFRFPTGLGWSIPLVGFVGSVLYLALCWRMTGRTFGDAVLGVRVVNYRGGQLRLAGALLRAIACVVFPVGVFWVAVSAANRSVQDVLLRTSVIYDWLPKTEVRMVSRESGASAPRTPQP
ncbi:MAG TPA: RDD family protein [Mycobacterium sp.]|nr:RDD family protein [Mycobacterium sp.]